MVSRLRNRNPLQIKLFVVYSLVFVFIMILASVPAYFYLKKGIERNALNNLDETVVTVNRPDRLATLWPCRTSTRCRVTGALQS